MAGVRFHVKESEKSYVVWQNRGLRFYLGSRLCYFAAELAPAAYCANQSIEQLLKGTLVYADPKFTPKAHGHGIAKMMRMVKNQMNADLHIPEYFCEEQRYNVTTRYPAESGRGFGVPASFLDDLDSVFFQLLQLVPFQFNTELKHVLKGRRYPARLNTLRRNNRQMRGLRRYLGVRLDKRK